MVSEKMSKADQMTMLMALQEEMAEIKRKHEEIVRRDEEEI